MSVNVAMATAAWGGAPPGWVLALARESDEGSQKWAGLRIKYSPGVVNAVLKKKYKGNLKRVQTAVEGALMAATVECPVVGEIGADKCLQIQRQALAPTNPERVKLWRACRGGCRHSRIQGPAFAKPASAGEARSGVLRQAQDEEGEGDGNHDAL